MREKVLIVSKTRMHNALCVGGLVLKNNRYVRLLNRGNKNQPSDTDFEIGNVWDINFVNRNPLIFPHIEDIIVLDKIFIENINSVLSFLQEKNIIDWAGHIDNLFDKKIKWSISGSGFIDERDLPNRSVGFWKVDRELKKSGFDGKIRYYYPNEYNLRSLTFVGLIPAIDVIPAGTILRVSLARWWKKDENTEKRCYLQLSGWYL
ncbi:MAG: hypothetical protein Q4A09_09155 [Capnocytophaga felis]|nr:hypothetical protein [Capnocytophaga felis]